MDAKDRKFHVEDGSFYVFDKTVYPAAEMFYGKDAAME
jgi:hypothetical protein